MILFIDEISTVNMGINFPNFKEIFDYSGKIFLDTQYSNYKYELNVKLNGDNFDMILKADKIKFIKLDEKISKQATEEERDKILTDREPLIKERAAFAEKTSEMFGTFRVKFYASVLDQMLNDIKSKKQVQKMSYQLSKNNVLHIIPGADRIELIYGISFMQDTDIALTKIFLTELEEAKRHVRNCIDAKCYLDKNGLPVDIAQVDNIEKYSNGLVVFNLYVKNYDLLKLRFSYFVNFRQYIQFHIHSIKTFLHIRMNKKGKEIENKINSAKIIPDEYLKELETLSFFTNREKKQSGLKMFADEVKKINV